MKVLLYITLIVSCNAYLFSLVGIHSCPEGHKSLYRQGGKILDTTAGPGFQIMVPFVTNMIPIKTTPDTDHIGHEMNHGKGMTCGSKKGANSYLKVSVVNQLMDVDDCVLKTVKQYTPEYDKPLIYDRIPHEVAEFCKDYSLEDIVIEKFHLLKDVLQKELTSSIQESGLGNCLKITSIAIQKPELDEDLHNEFKKQEMEIKMQHNERTRKDTIRIRLETERQSAILEMEKKKDVERIRLDTEQMIAESERAKQTIVNEMLAEKVRKEADAKKYAAEQEAAALEKLFSLPNYIKLKGLEAAHSNAKLIIGDTPQSALSLLNLN